MSGSPDAGDFDTFLTVVIPMCLSNSYKTYVSNTTYYTELYSSQQVSTLMSHHHVIQIINPRYIIYYGPGSSVGIAIDYGLGGPGSNSGGDEIFRPSRPALGHTQSPVKWVPGLSRG